MSLTAVVHQTSMEPFVPAGTTAAFALISPPLKFNVETTGRV